jgi:hypothetical protein
MGSAGANYAGAYQSAMGYADLLQGLQGQDTGSDAVQEFLGTLGGLFF